MSKLYFYYQKNPLQWLLSSKLNVVINNEQYFMISSKSETVKEVESGKVTVQISVPYLGSEIGKAREEFVLSDEENVYITYKSPLFVFSSGTIFIEKGNRSDFKTPAISELIKTYLKLSIFIAAVFLILGFIYTSLINSIFRNSYQNSITIEETNSTNTQQNDETVVQEPASSETVNQKNAMRKADAYIEMMAFSRNGLIKQLEFEGFATEDAIYGADHIGADWFEQAALKAKSYLDMMAFSRDGLITQLEFEGFTHDEAVYGVESTGLK